MFTKPQSCCMFISLRWATLILATLQLLGCAFHAYFFYQMYPDSLFKHISVGINVFLALISAYGIYGVFTKNVRYVRLFAIYYWYEFISSMVSFIAYAVGGLYFKNEYCQIIAEDVNELNICIDSYFSIYLTTIVLFSIGTLLRVHYCFSIWGYYRQLQTESTQAIGANEPKITYPQYVFVALPEKAPITEQA